MSKSNSSKAHQLGTADRQGEGSAGLRSEHGTAQRKTADGRYECGEIQETDVCKSAFYERHYGEVVLKLTVEAEVTVSLPWGERTEQGVGIWDTGATQSSIAKHFADRLGIVAQPPTDDELQPMTVMQTILQGSTLATIRIGDIVLPHMSLKVVSVGVLPLIFAYSFLAFPGTIAQLIDPKTEGWFTQWWTRNMYTGSVWYMIISALLIIAFTFFYSSISFDPKQQAEQLQQQGAVIPGQRGRNIRQYLQNIMNRLNLFAALFLAILAAVPTLLLRLAGVQVPFAASSILIAVSVSLETVRTIQGEMSVRGIDMDMDNVGFM